MAVKAPPLFRSCEAPRCADEKCHGFLSTKGRTYTIDDASEYLPNAVKEVFKCKHELALCVNPSGNGMLTTETQTIKPSPLAQNVYVCQNGFWRRCTDPSRCGVDSL